MGRWIARLIAAQDGWARPLGDFNQRWMSAFFRPIRPLKDLLSGVWLGHPLHAASTDIPIGTLLISVVLDLLGQPAAADCIECSATKEHAGTRHPVAGLRVRPDLSSCMPATHPPRQDAQLGSGFGNVFGRRVTLARPVRQQPAPQAAVVAYQNSGLRQ